MWNYEVFKGSTKRGQYFYKMGTRYDAAFLHQVYGRYSKAKENAFNECFDQYILTDEHDAFSICSHNSQCFSVSWVGLYNGENALFYITRDHNRVILLDK